MNQPTDQLAQRLRELPLDEPRPERTTSRVLGAAARPAPARLLPRLAIAAAILVAAGPVSWGVLYFSPATSAALADASGPGFSHEILDNFGLGTENITAQNSSATSSGYKVQLVGAYADSIRTVVLLKSDPPVYASGFMQLTDQFGTTYNPRNGEGNLLTGDQALSFEAASWLSMNTGMRFTLTFNQLELLDGSSVRGSWTVKGVVLLKTGTLLHAPPPGPLGSGMVRFTEVRYVGRVISIQAEVRGVSLDGEVPPLKQGAKPSPRFQVELAPIDGSLGKPANSFGWSSSGDVTKLQLLFVNVDPGTYYVILSLAGEGQLQSTLVVG
jgi:hypothetical protein